MKRLGQWAAACILFVGLQLFFTYKLLIPDIGVVCGRGRNPTLSRPAVFPGEMNMLPSKRRDVGEERRIRGYA